MKAYEMECFVCGRRVVDGFALFRQNPTGEAGVWACREHNSKAIDPTVNEIVGLVERTPTEPVTGADK